MQIEIAQQVAIVTGSAHRVGKAIALELARHGVNIAVHYADSSEDTARATVKEIKSEGVDAFAAQADLSQPEGVSALFAAVEEYFGRLHILVNSASIFQQRDLMNVTLADWQLTLAINLTAPFLCTQAAVPLLRRNNPSGGVIINILDQGANEPWPRYPHHGVSKAGLGMLTKVSAVSLAPDIRVNGVIPGAVMKPPDLSDDAWQQIGQETPIQRTGSAEDVARAVAYLVREDFITGSILTVDGGAGLA